MDSLRPESSARKRIACGPTPSPQDFDAGAEVDVVGLSRQDERGDRLHPGPLRFADAVFRLTEVHDFHVETRPVERFGDVLFGGDTHGTARVIEYGFGFHGGCLTGSVVTEMRRPLDVARPFQHRLAGAVEGTFRWSGYVLVPAFCAEALPSTVTR